MVRRHARPVRKEADRQSRGRRVDGHLSRRDVRPGGGIRLRQVVAGAHHRGDQQANVRQDRGRRTGRHHAAGRGAEALQAKRADDLPGPLRFAEPAHDGGRDHPGADGYPRHRRRSRCAKREGGRVAAHRRAEARPHPALSARILWRPAPAHLHRAHAGDRAAVHHMR